MEDWKALVQDQRESGLAMTQIAGESPAKKRKMLRRADYASSQMFNPHNPSAIEIAPLESLWQVVSKGSKWTEFYSYLADDDAVRQGVAISQFAQTILHAMRQFREDRVRIILKDEIYKKVKAVVDELYPHFEVLDGGQRGGIGGGFGKLSKTVIAKDEGQVDSAAKAIYEWLQKPSDPFRAYLQIMSGAGMSFAAQCEEKIMRSYIKHKPATVGLFALSAKKRLCSDEGTRAGQVQERDDMALTQG